MEIDRRIQIEFNFLAQSNDFVTIKDIAKIVNVSDRTLKNDLPILRQFIKEHGGSLVSKQGNGLKIDVIDKKLFDESKLKFHIKYSYIDKDSSMIQSRSNLIVKILIAQQDAMKIDEIAEKLYVSRGTIKQELKNVREFVNAFGLEVKSIPGKGILIEGEEFRKRLCMVELVNVHFPYSIYEEDDGTEFWGLFDKEDKITFRNIELSILRGTSTRMIDSFINKLSRYLQLTKNRIAKGHYAIVGDMYKNVLNTFKEHDIANIFAKEYAKIGLVLNDDEVYCIELLLLFWADLYGTTNIEKEYPAFKDDVRRIATLSFEDIRKTVNIDFLTEDNVQMLSLSLIPILSRIYFNYVYLKLTSNAFEKSSARLSSTSMALAEIVAYRIKKEFDVSINEYDVVRIASVFYGFVDKVEFRYIPRNIVLYINSGFAGSVIMKNKLERYFGKDKFNRIDIYEYYEGRVIDESLYDHAIMNFKEFTYRYNLPFVFVSQVPTLDQFENVYKKVILSGYQINELINKINFSVETFAGDSLLQLAGEIAYEVSDSLESHKKITKRILNIEKYFIKNKILNIIVSEKLCKDNYFMLYKLDKKLMIDDSEINYVNFISVNCKNDIEMLKLINMVNVEMNRNGKSLEGYLKAEDKKQFINEMIGNQIRL